MLVVLAGVYEVISFPKAKQIFVLYYTIVLYCIALTQICWVVSKELFDVERTPCYVDDSPRQQIYHVTVKRQTECILRGELDVLPIWVVGELVESYLWRHAAFWSYCDNRG